jgi:hypothetical protein
MQAHTGFNKVNLLLFMRTPTFISECDKSQQCKNSTFLILVAEEIQYETPCWHSMFYQLKTCAFLISETKIPKTITGNL